MVGHYTSDFCVQHQVQSSLSDAECVEYDLPLVQRFHIFFKAVQWCLLALPNLHVSESSGRTEVAVFEPGVDEFFFSRSQNMQAC